MVAIWSPLPVRSAGEVHDNLYFGLKAKKWGHMVQKSVEFECANLVQTESWYTCCVWLSVQRDVWGDHGVVVWRLVEEGKVLVVVLIVCNDMVEK